MKAYEFPAKITPEGTLEVPEELLDNLAGDRIVRVIVLVKEIQRILADFEKQSNTEQTEDSNDSPSGSSH